MVGRKLTPEESIEKRKRHQERLNLRLRNALWRGEDAVRKQLRRGADAEARTGSGDGQTALLRAVGTLKVGCVRVLLEHGVDLEARGAKGWTALMWAVEYGHVEIMRMLLKAGANVEACARDGRTALLISVASGRAECVKVLMEHRDGVAMTGRGGEALVMAARHDAAEVIQVLLDHGADIEARDAQGYSALHEAVKAGALKCATLIEQYQRDRAAAVVTAGTTRAALASGNPTASTSHCQ